MSATAPPSKRQSSSHSRAQSCSIGSTSRSICERESALERRDIYLAVILQRVLGNYSQHFFEVQVEVAVVGSNLLLRHMCEQSVEKLHLLQFKMDEIIDKCLRINQVLDIHPNAFTLKDLRSKDWYLEVLNILFPYLADKFHLIAQCKSQSQAIDGIILLLTQEDFIEKDFLQIKGEAIVDGDEDCIFYVVELIEALLERTMEEAEETEEEGQQRAVPKGQQRVTQQRVTQQRVAQQRVAQQRVTQQRVAQQRVTQQRVTQQRVVQQRVAQQRVTQQRVAQQRVAQQRVAQQRVAQQRVAQQRVAQQRVAQQRVVQRGEKKQEGECHSVQAIHDQFEQDESEGEEILYKNGGNYQSYANAFSDNKSEESQDSHYLKQLQKCKSEEQLHKAQKHLATTNFTKPKAYHQVNPNKTQNAREVSKGLRKIVVHPKLKKSKKPLNKKAKQFTSELGQEVSKQISRIVMDKQGKQEKMELSQGIRAQIEKKNREYECKVKEIQKERRLRLRKEKYISKAPMESDAKLKSLLKWKEAKLQKAKRTEMSVIINKLQSQKERYVKTVNQLIVNMERQKQIDEHREFQEQMSRAKRKARLRIAAMEQKFRDELDILRESKNKQKAEEKIVVAGHREVVKQIQEELKREHKQKVALLLRQCNQNQNEVNNDLQELTHKIVDAYKKK